MRINNGSPPISSKTTQHEWDFTIQANCADSLNNVPTERTNDLRDAVISNKIHQVTELVYGTGHLFEILYEHTCEQVYNLVDEAGTVYDFDSGFVAFGYVQLDTVDNKVIIFSTDNTDFPSTEVADKKSTARKKFFIRSSIVGFTSISA